MTPAEFRKTAMRSGYGCAETTDEYIRKTGKAEYTEDDFIELYRLHERWLAWRERPPEWVVWTGEMEDAEWEERDGR